MRWDGDGIGLSQFHALQPQQGKRLSACVPQASEGRCPHLTGYAMEARAQRLIGKKLLLQPWRQLSHGHRRVNAYALQHLHKLGCV